jgi:polysaccharide pyruvyl transferase WcaK-like protein
MSTCHIALWGAWYGSHNLGDQAILVTLTDMLRERLGEVRFTVFTNNPQHVLDYGPRESGCDIRALSNRRQFLRVAATLAACDLFVIGGGVPFYQQPYHLAVMATLVGLARAFRTPYMTWSVSSQRIDSPAARRLFRWVGNGSAAMTYRDPLTAAMFRSCGVKKEMHWCADPVFRLTPQRGPAVRELIQHAGHRLPGRPLAALACRQMRHDAPYSVEHHNPKTPAIIRCMVESFAAALDWMWESGYQPILLPMNTVEPDDDRVMARRILAAARHGSQALTVDDEMRPRTMPALFEQCALCVVSRLHAGVLALVGRCPMVMYSIGPKMTGIMETMGLSQWNVVDDRTSPGEVVALLARLDGESDAVRTQMAQRIERLREQATVGAGLACQILAGRNA